MSCTALAHLFEASGDRNEMFRSKTQWAIRSGMISKLVPRLCDPSGDVRRRAIEAARNMLSVGGKISCDAFMKIDVLTVLEKLFVESASLDALKGMFLKKEESLRSDLYAILSVFGLLAEQSDVAVHRITKSIPTRQCISLCIRAHADLPMVAELAAQLLHIISDNNPIFAKQIRASVPEDLKMLIQDKIKDGISSRARGSAMRTRLHIAGMFCNVLEERDIVVLKLLRDCIQISPLNCLNAAIEAWSHTTTSTSSSSSSEGESWNEMARVQMTALEILANLFSCNDDDDDDETADLKIAPDIQYQLIDSVISLVRAFSLSLFYTNKHTHTLTHTFISNIDTCFRCRKEMVRISFTNLE